RPRVRGGAAARYAARPRLGGGDLRGVRGRRHRAGQARPARAQRDPADDGHRRPLAARPRREAVRALLRAVAAVSGDLRADLRAESRGVCGGTVPDRPPVPAPHGRAGGRPGHGGVAGGRPLCVLTPRMTAVPYCPGHGSAYRRRGSTCRMSPKSVAFLVTRTKPCSRADAAMRQSFRKLRLNPPELIFPRATRRTMMSAARVHVVWLGVRIRPSASNGATQSSWY